MRIAIITLQSEINYGGILQEYALLQYLKGLGFDAYMIDRVNRPYLYSWDALKQITKNFIRKYLLRRKNCHRLIPDNLSPYITQYTSTFHKEYIHPKTCLIERRKDLKKLNKYKFKAYIVGSDQVWRKKYNFSSLSFFNLFLDFIYDKEDVIKISYASSFGVDYWEFTQKETEKIRKLIKKFKAVSVREISGVNLCHQYLGVKAEQMIDPTMLLKKRDYQIIIEKKQIKSSEGELALMILDKTEDKNKCIYILEKKYGYKSYSRYRQNTKMPYPMVEEWLKGFDDAKLIFTDSFHGCVFSIIFNKPFFVYGNTERGKTRFDSLLNKFGLEDRYITSSEDLQLKRARNINWETINEIIHKERNKAKEYLLLNLSSYVQKL